MTDWRETLRDRLATAAERHDVPGASIAVGLGADVVAAATGALDLATGAEVTTDSLFHVGSVTKPWTAVLALQLADDGLIDLDEPVRRYLPGFAVASPEATATVTTRQLLAHTAGFVGDLFLDTGDADDALDRFLGELRTEAVQIHPPGALFSYCNSGYCVLGALVARLRGTTWETAARSWIAEPLRARLIAFSTDEAGAFTTATGHLPAGGDGPLAAVDGVLLPRSNASAGSMMRAAPRELVRFGRSLLGTGVPLLSAGAAAGMRRPQVAVPGGGGRTGGHWGLGLELWNWGGAALFGHDGDVPGESTVFRILPERELVVAMSINTNGIRAMVDDVVVPLVREITGVEAPPWPVPSVDGTGDSARFAGRYATPLWDHHVTADGADLIVRSTPKGLVARMGRAPRTDRYAPLGGDSFVTTEHETITFVDDGRYLHNGRAAPRVG